HNITERKRAEEERERLIDELDAYAHTVAHDLKTPLTSLVGFSNLLEQHYSHMEPERITKNLSIIAQKGHQMTNIINELLLLASVRRLEDIAVDALDMEVIVSNALHRFEQRLEEMQAHIIRPDSWPVAAGYAPWVEEVWVNYISNALKYGGQPPRITIGWEYHNTSEAPEAAASLRFWVRDNGPGLSAEQQAQLFTHFTRLHKTRAQGYGLGLSIVQRIITKLGGEVGVESIVGEGSTFWFTLPTTQGVADSDKERE
ncbi:MAG: hybrid sensor histidine kinase/response regulator, partial [Chloroflexi bacterium]|nr:hybrid sensor histidine kinase/response regulator [Chloroflexota bacterium]